MAGKAIIDKHMCKGCGLCINFCPQKILTFEKQLNAKGFYPATILDESKCTGCAICARMCPEAAIEVFRDEVKK
jgi:2-oxoglutarate ferredoxin oxidoreductase subunit delta